MLPLVLGGILTGVVAALLGGGFWRRAGLVVTGSVLTGLGATLIVQSWLDVVGGDFFANSAALSLTVLAIAATVTGLHALLGKAGIALGALTMVFIGNPFSGVATSPDMLPVRRGRLGQLLPPGAGGNLLRSTGFFDGAGAGEHVAVLAAVGAARARPAGRSPRCAARARGGSRSPLKRGDPHLGRASAIRRSGVCGRGTFGEAEGLSPPVALAI